MRLVAATRDPTTLKPKSTWYLATSLPRAQVSTAQVHELCRLRDWIAHSYKPVKHELGWADYQVRAERAIVRHWCLVMLAYTFSLLGGAVPSRPLARRRATAGPAGAPTTPAAAPSPNQEATGGGKVRPTSERRRVRGARDLGGNAALGAKLALPVGTAAALLARLASARPLDASPAPT